MKKGFDQMLETNKILRNIYRRFSEIKDKFISERAEEAQEYLRWQKDENVKIRGERKLMEKKLKEKEQLIRKQEAENTASLVEKIAILEEEIKKKEKNFKFQNEKASKENESLLLENKNLKKNLKIREEQIIEIKEEIKNLK